MIHNYIDDTRPIESVLEALDTLLRDTCQPSGFLYIAMDGLVPYGKIVQQRYRRFRTPDGPAPVFDRNQISPGTPYMKDLATAVRSKFPYSVLSCTETPGEGEHKLFEWLKTMEPSQRTNTCIYGLDADLILLSLAQKDLCTLTLLRENQSFQSKIEGFSVLSVNALSGCLPIPSNQYVALCVLCFGNDFMPALGMFSLREGGHERAIECYRQSGSPDLLTIEGRQLFLRTAHLKEMQFYQEKVRARDNSAERCILSGDGKHFEERYNLHLLDGLKNVQYLVHAYWTTFHWTLHYFTQNECLDWNWVYPYAEAPLIQQLIRYEEIPMSWERVKEPVFTITKQLQFILPSTSLRQAKKRVMFPDELYNEETDTRVPWMRRHQWECEPRISLPTEGLTEVQSFQCS
jgi:5'-3' exonuclease